MYIYMYTVTNAECCVKIMQTCFQDEKARVESLGGCVLFMGAWRVNGNLAVSRAIGTAPSVVRLPAQFYD